MNPTARLYTMHSEHHIPLNFEVYKFDIEKANTVGPEMELFIDFKRDFDLKNLSPSQHELISNQLLTNSESAKAYNQFRWKTDMNCNEKC